MYWGTVIFAFILTSGLGSPVFEYEAQSEVARLKTLMAAFLKWVALEMDSEPEHGNMMSPNLKNTKLKSTLLDTDIFVSYLTFERISEAKKVVDKYSINPKTLATTFRITLPVISETYRYKVNGTILSHKVSGEGRLTYKSRDTSLTVSDLKFHDSPHNLQISSMKLDTKIHDLDIKFGGLRVQGMRLSAFEKVLQAKILGLLKELFHFSKARTTELEANLDMMLYGKSLEQIVKWLKQHTKK